MKKIMTKLFAFVSLCLISVCANAQIEYSDWSLSINKAPKSCLGWGLSIDEWPGMYWTCKDKKNFFLLDVSPSNPRLAGTGNQVAFYNTATGTFNSIQVANVYNFSDARAKENVQTLTTGLNTVLQLHPVTYNWKPDVVILTDSLSGSATLNQSLSRGPAEEQETQYGFLAQEVEEVLPDAVKTDEVGNKLVNYTAMIPLLVQAVQNLQAVVEAQAQKIEELSAYMPAKSNAASNNRNKIVSCTPNPTNGNVTITTELDANVNAASIAITNLSGTREKTFAVSSNMQTISENVSSLDPGIYIVTLLVDNVSCGSVRLIKE